MHQDFPVCCRMLCELVDWTHPALAGSPVAAAYQEGDVVGAARLFIRYLREREEPQWIFSPAYARRVREHATPAYREQAAKALEALTADGAAGNYGKVVCLPFLPAQTFHAAATREFFDTFTDSLIDQRDHWGAWGCQTIFRWFETIQAAWPMEECPDDFFIPALSWLIIEGHEAWAFTQQWHEAMLGTAGHNWWAFELCALWKISLYFPEFTGTAKYRTFYPTYVEREVALSLDFDGYSVEQSVSYHWALLDIVAGTVHIAEINGLPVSATLRRQLDDCARFPYRVVAPDGTEPGFGDYGGGKIIDRVRETAAFNQLPEAKFVAERLTPAWQSPVDGMMLFPHNMGWVGEDLAPAYQALTPVEPSLDTALPRAGIYAMRSSWEPTAHYLCIEACPRGAIATSHGHTSLLNFVAHSHGTPVLIDSSAGWETDTSGAFWRVGSFAHNVATVDGEHHLPIRGMFRWDQSATPVVETWESTPSYTYFGGVHEAFERLPKKVSATRRKIFGLRNGYWILIDRFTAGWREDAHTYTQHFQVNLPCHLDADGRAVTTGEAGNLLIVPAGVGVITPHLEPCPYPLDHYVNPDHLTYTLETQGSAVLVTLLAPFLGKNVPTIQANLLPVQIEERELTSFEATGLEIIIDGQRDVYVDIHTHWHQAWTCGGYAGEERLFHSRCMADITAKSR
ncbi:MAG: heparinase II/III domain-containing protein [Armatimonadota bacterium]